MKQKLLVLMAILMAAVSSAWADEITNDVYIATNGTTIRYNLNHTQKTAEVYYGPSNPSVVEIPEKVKYNNEDYSVTAIGAEAFHYRYSLTSISLPNSVTSIGSKAFQYWNMFTSTLNGL